MLNRLIDKTVLATKVKILFARIPYVIVTLFYGKKPRLVTKQGINYELDLSEGIDLSIFLFGKYQEHVIKNKIIALPKDGLVIDIGANMGVMTLQFAKKASEGKVYSFEPTHYSLARLKRNLELNPELSKRVEVINSFVSEKSSANANLIAFSSWKVSGENVGDTHPVHKGIAKSTEGVGSITLDDFCKSRNLPKIDLIKIDTDGHEYDILLKGERGHTKKYRPKLIFEAGIYAMTEKNIDFSHYVNYFNELNYRLFESVKGVEITMANYKRYIPENGTIDIIAAPLVQKA